MASNINPPLIIAHRGASSLAPENTFAAFERAIADGADGIEFDVRLANDGVPVVIHDATLKRTAGLSGRVDDYSAKELGQIDVGSWFTAKGDAIRFSGERIQTLAATLEYLENFPGRIYIELKCEETDAGPLARAVCSVIKDAKAIDRFIVKSFRLSVIPHVRHYCPRVRVAALFTAKIGNILRKENHLVKIAGEFGVDELSIHYLLATPKLLKKAAKSSLPVTIWTVDNPRWVARAIRLGLSSIITNDPGRLIRKRAELLEEGQQTT